MLQNKVSTWSEQYIVRYLLRRSILQLLCRASKKIVMWNQVNDCDWVLIVSNTIKVVSQFNRHSGLNSPPACRLSDN